MRKAAERYTCFLLYFFVVISLLPLCVARNRHDGASSFRHDHKAVLSALAVLAAENEENFFRNAALCQHMHNRMIMQNMQKSNEEYNTDLHNMLNYANYK